MRFYNIIYQKIRFAALVFLCILITGTLSAQQQKKEKARQMVDVTVKVTDESGTPVPNASVIVGEGVIHAETDENGSFTFKAFTDAFVTVSSRSVREKCITCYRSSQGQQCEACQIEDLYDFS